MKKNARWSDLEIQHVTLMLLDEGWNAKAGDYGQGFCIEWTCFNGEGPFTLEEAWDYTLYIAADVAEDFEPEPCRDCLKNDPDFEVCVCPAV
ncbi:MAG: hypothetical protein H0U23_00450 [Blastocatellia bacterium]|nr:hypothetical protein [Blastocatellia bacterium]